MFVLLGCTPIEKVWVKDGATEADYRTDADDCRMQAYAAPGVGQVGLAYSTCMQRKGWQIEERPVKK
jgi:hypothetical protein